VARVGILTFSDGRESVHRDVEKFARGVENGVAAALEAAGHEVVRAREIVWSNRLAVSEARRVADARPDLTVFNIPVWAFPHFSMLAANETPGPLLLFSNINPEQPGMVGMLAAAGGSTRSGARTDAPSGTSRTSPCSRRSRPTPGPRRPSAPCGAARSGA